MIPGCYNVKIYVSKKARFLKNHSTPSGTVCQFVYDEFGRTTQIKVSEGINGTTSRTFLYDKQSNLVQVQDFLANVTTKFQYDLIGRTVGINMSDGQF